MTFLYFSFVYVDLPIFNLSVQANIHSQSLNITWSSESLEPMELDNYILTVSSVNTQLFSFLVEETYYEFTAPKRAPACEVYNFSVTATYVGANYTGAGCSEPSPVIGRMLPSLPNVVNLESSLNYKLEKKTNGTTQLSLELVIVRYFQFIKVELVKVL